VIAVIATVSVSGLPDPDAAAFLEVALAAGAPLVTGNPRQFPAAVRRGVTVELPGAFLRRFG
jgi:hypothetical protein